MAALTVNLLDIGAQLPIPTGSFSPSLGSNSRRESD
jgi:hypothetical protein